MPRYLISFLTLITTAALLGGCGAINPLQPAAVGSGTVNITVPSTLVVLSVNGKEIDAPNLYSGSYQLNVGEGSQRIIVKYEANWNSQGESGFIVEWPPNAIDYNFSSATTYALAHPAVNDRETALELRKSSPIWLIAGSEKVAGKAVTEKKEATSYMVSEETPDEVTRVDQLKDLWNSSSKQDQADFLQWLNAQ